MSGQNHRPNYFYDGYAVHGMTLVPVNYARPTAYFRLGIRRPAEPAMCP